MQLYLYLSYIIAQLSVTTTKCIGIKLNDAFYIIMMTSSSQVISQLNNNIFVDIKFIVPFLLKMNKKREEFRILVHIQTYPSYPYYPLGTEPCKRSYLRLGLTITCPLC